MGPHGVRCNRAWHLLHDWQRFIVKILVFFLVFALGVLPASAGFFPESGGFIQIASAQGGQSKKKPSSGKVVIRGKGGKVTGVVQQPDGRKRRIEKRNSCKIRKGPRNHAVSGAFFVI